MGNNQFNIWNDQKYQFSLEENINYHLFGTWDGDDIDEIILKAVDNHRNVIDYVLFATNKSPQLLSIYLGVHDQGGVGIDDLLATNQVTGATITLGWSVTGTLEWITVREGTATVRNLLLRFSTSNTLFPNQPVDFRVWFLGEEIVLTDWGTIFDNDGVAWKLSQREGGRDLRIDIHDRRSIPTFMV